MSSAFLVVQKEVCDLIHALHSSKSVLCPRPFFFKSYVIFQWNLLSLGVMEVEHLERFKWGLIIYLSNENTELLR